MDRNEAEALLAAARTSFEGALERLGAVDALTPDPGVSWSERGQVLEERDEVLGSVEELDVELAEITAAQARLADGRYGVCETCHETIPDERLLAIPWARGCVKHPTARGNGRR